MKFTEKQKEAVRNFLRAQAYNPDCANLPNNTSNILLEDDLNKFLIPEIEKILTLKKYL
jgi:hypothetical protein